MLLDELLNLGRLCQPKKLTSEAESEPRQEASVVLALDVLPKICNDIGVLNPTELLRLR